MAKTGAQTSSLLNGIPDRAIGVNCFDLFYGQLFHHRGVRPASERLKELRHGEIPFVRFSASPFWPKEWLLYHNDPFGYFGVLDEVVAAAENNQVGLVPSLFWNPVSVSDMVGEPVSAWGRSDSRTRAFMVEFTEKVVARYQHSASIWMWEFGNEFNSYADLQTAVNQTDLENLLKRWPRVDVSKGTPARRSVVDLMSVTNCADVFAHFGRVVRRLDPTRYITAGTDIPRYNASRLASNIAEGKWLPDSPAQFRTALKQVTPDPLDVISVHIYPDREGQYFGLGKSSQFSDILYEVVTAGRGLGKKIFVGEFGVPRMNSRDEEKRKLRRLLDSILSTKVNWSALWVYDRMGDEEWSARFDNDRAWQLEWIAQANATIRAER
jgi:hypothetical protein